MCARLRFCRSEEFWLSCVVCDCSPYEIVSVHCLGDFLASAESFRITTLDGGRGAGPAFRAARPTHVSFEAEMSQNVIAAQKVRGRASPLGSVEPPRGPPNPKRDIRGDARLGIVQTRNAPPRTPRARASRLDRALTSPTAPTHRPSRLRRDSSTSGARRWYVSRARAARGSGTKPPRGGSAPTARLRLLRASLVRGCAKRLLRSCFARHTIETIALRLTRRPSPRAQDTVTSMIIPMGFAAAGITLLVRGIDNLSWGKNRKEGF